MRHFLSLLLSILLFSFSNAQLIQGTLKPGSTPNSVIVAIRSNTTFTGQITGLNITLQIPSTVSPAPTVSILNNPLSANVPTENFATAVTTENGFINYLFVNNPTGTPAVNFVANTEINLLELQFANGPTGVVSQVRLANLPSGGSNSQQYFYIEVGADRTNEASMFYGAAAMNDPGGYAAYSFVSINGVVLPVNWLKFTAVRQGNDVMLNWDVADERNTDRYEVEVSPNGVDFASFATKQRTSGSGSKNYNHLDKQVGRYNSKILHYRIKQYDLDGKFSYSPIKTVRLDVKGETSLFPNPAKEGFTLTIPYLNPNQDKVQLHLVNPLGQVVDRKDITRLAAVNYYYNLQSSLITSGEYLLKIFEDGQLAETKRVLIKK
jgi:hypothetical protein